MKNNELNAIVFQTAKNRFFDKIHLSTFLLGIYFVLLPFDMFSIGQFGSLLKIFSILPLLFSLFRIKRRIEIDKISFVFLIYAFYTLLTPIYSISASKSFSNSISFLSNIALVFICGKLVSYNKKEITFLKIALAFAGVLAICLTFIFAGYSYDMRLSIHIGGKEIDNNTLNGYVFFLLASVSLIYFEKKKFLFIVPLLAIFVFTLMTGSRGALISMLVITLFVALYINRRKIRFIHLIFIAFAFLLIVISMPLLKYVVPESVLGRFSGASFTDGTYRLAIWKSLFRAFSEANLARQLFGFGLGTSPIISENYYGLYIVAHNVWVDMLIEGGLIGSLILVILQFTFLKTSFKTKDPFIISLYLGFLVMSFTLSLTSFKPLWDTMMMIFIIDDYKKKHENKNINIY